jgi:hypothetical protein
MADPSQTKNKNKETTGQPISGAADKARDTAATVSHKASEMASNLGHKAQDLASTAASRADDTLASVGEGMSSLAGTVRQNAPREGMLGSAAGTLADTLQAGGKYLQEHGLEDMGEDVRGFVRQYPLGSLLAVFGLGLLMGRALGR